MNTLFRGELSGPGSRCVAWLDSLLVDHAILRLAWRNFAPVIPGRLYRSNHPTPGALAGLVRRYRIRSLINLRGNCGNGSDALSREAARRLGVVFIDLPLKSRVAPPRETLLRIIELFAGVQMPALVHCKSGIDRAGFAAGVFLLCNGGTAGEALRQLSPRHGHLPGSAAGVLRDIFRRYAEVEHRQGFAEWVEQAYDPLRVQREFAPKRVSVWLTDRILIRE